MPPKATTRRAVLLAFGAVMGKFNVLRASQDSQALLIVDLSQWRGIQFKHKGKSIVVPVAEVFDALVDSE